MAKSIPASQIVRVIPSVQEAGGRGVQLNGVFLTHSSQVPVGAVQPFSNAIDVSDYFGPNSDEGAKATIYFNGFDGSNIKPGTLYFAQYNAAAVSAYLRGGDLTALTIAQINALAIGSITVVMDGYTHAAASVNLSGATSYSGVATIINAAINASEPTEATSTLSSIAGTTLTVGGVITGTWAVGQTVSGAGVTANSVILSQLGGTPGGAGTYQLSQSSTVAGPEAISGVATAITCTFDSVSGGLVFTSGITGGPSTAAYATGTLAASLFLTQQTGAIVSQGAAAAVPSSFMDGVVAVTQNWATFATLFDPDGGSGNTVKLAFAAWVNAQGNRYAYACWDVDQSPGTQVPATSSMGYVLTQLNSSGTVLIYTPTGGDASKAAFEMGTAASIDFEETNGRITFKFRSQTGLSADVRDQTFADNLEANGYNYYGAWATALDGFTFFAPGTVTGPFKWADSYYDQVWLNAQFQLDLMNLLTQVKSVPYTQRGYDLIQASLGSTIQAGLNFGAFSPGVLLSSLEAAAVNNSAGLDITKTLDTQGWYLQVRPADAATRASRTSPPCTFWYCDAGAVQKIVLDSIEIQ